MTVACDRWMCRGQVATHHAFGHDASSAPLTLVVIIIRVHNVYIRKTIDCHLDGATRAGGMTAAGASSWHATHFFGFFRQSTSSFFFAWCHASSAYAASRIDGSMVSMAEFACEMRSRSG